MSQVIETYVGIYKRKGCLLRKYRAAHRATKVEVMPRTPAVRSREDITDAPDEH